MGFTGTGFASKGTKTIVNVTAFKALCSAMALRPRTKAELHELTGLTNTTVSRWVNVLAAGKERILYIAEYKRTGDRGNWAALYSLGYGMPDAIKPKPLTQSEYAKRWRAKQEQKHATVVETSTGLIHKSGFEKPVPHVKPGTYHSATHGRGATKNRKETSTC